MMESIFRHASQIFEEAEKRAKDGVSFGGVMKILRQASLEEVGWLLVCMPSPEYPALSKVLPAMAPAEVQQKWTGSSGKRLFNQTSAFARILESQFSHQTGRSLAGEGRKILDYGVGYGRILRMMYFFTDAENIYGADAWQGSLDHSLSAGLSGTLKKVDAIPQSLPFDGVEFDLIYCFSVLTHVSEQAALAIFESLRQHIKPNGLLVATVRPEEQWAFNRSQGRDVDVEGLVARHRSEGFAFNDIGAGPNYGDASISFSYLAKIPGWRFVGYDLSLNDPLQIAALFRPIMS